MIGSKTVRLTQNKLNFFIGFQKINKSKIHYKQEFSGNA